MKTLISLLSGHIEKENNQWRTSKNHYFRVAAAAYLLEKEPEAVVLIQGGLAAGDRPTLAAVIARELEDLDIPRNRMILEEYSEKTVQQLFHLQTFAKEHCPEKIQVLSSDWHMPRVAAMINYVSGLKELRKLSPQFIGAEDVLLSVDGDLWSKEIVSSRIHSDFKKTLAMEKQGVEQILDGTYKYD